MVVVQWFPPRPYWDRTALKLGDELRLTAIAPGLPNHLLDREYPGLNPELDLDWFDDEDETPTKIKGAIVPVVSLEPTALRSWSRLVAGYGDATVAGRRFELVWDQNRESWQGPSKKVQRRLPESGEQRVKLFGQTASRLAQELAGLMSLAPVSPEITDLIRETLLPNAYAMHVAEVFLSGLLEETEGEGYRFVERAKAALRKSMTTVDEQLVFRVVSRFVSEKYKLTTREFEAFLLERGVGLHELEAEVFAELRDRSKASLVRFEPFEVTYGEWEIELELKATLGLRANAEVTVVEPVFEEIEFTVAQLSETEDDNDIKTALDLIPDTLPRPAMPSGVEAILFEYAVVTLNPDGSEQAREIEHTTGFVETLEKQEVLEDRLDTTTKQRPVEITVSKKRSIRFEMVGIPGGEFLMGSPDKENGNDNEKPQHLVTVPPFYLGRVPVTQSQWRFVAGLDRIDRNLEPKPSRFSGDDLPVERVSWEDATEFCARLSAHTGRAYRLPTEAEWEYACRAGTTTPFHFGETLNTSVVNYDGNDTYGNGQKGQYRRKTTPVGSLNAANAWGLFDMHGNVWEWCEDDWHNNYEDAPTDGSAWLDRENEKHTKILRGGSWNFTPRNCRSASQYYFSRNSRNYYTGVRVACAAPRLS
jgi:formylglycine-generating enzyme required for sulfatase activity